MKEEREKAGLKLNIQKTKIMASSPITSWQMDGGKMETAAYFIFLGFRITVDGDCNHEIKWHLPLGRKAMTNLNSILKSRDITLLTKVHIVKGMVFPVVMYRCELDHKDGWVLKNWCFQTVVLEKTLVQVPWTARRSNQSILKKYQPWIFFGRTDAEAEAPIIWPPDMKSQLIGKDPDSGKDWRQEEKGAAEDETVR